MVEASYVNEPRVPPLEDVSEAFSGTHYADQVTDLIKAEYEKATKEWRRFPKEKMKTKGMILCLCLNTEYDPEEWREDISRDVPVARKECGFDFWNFDELEGIDSRRQPDRNAYYDKILHQLTEFYFENIGTQLEQLRYAFICFYILI